MIKKRERQLSEMVYFKNTYVQDLEDLVERLKLEISQLKEELEKGKKNEEVSTGDYGDYVGIDVTSKEENAKHD